MVDIDKIVEKLGKKYVFYQGFRDSTGTAIDKYDVQDIVNEAIKQAIPIILKEVSEKACLHTIGRGLGAYEEVDKDSILSLEQELIQKLLKNE